MGKPLLNRQADRNLAGHDKSGVRSDLPPIAQQWREDIDSLFDVVENDQRRISAGDGRTNLRG